MPKKEEHPLEEPHVFIKEQTDRKEEGKIELDEIREENQTEDTDLLNGFEEKKKEFPRVYDPTKKEYHISRDEIDERYGSTDMEKTNEFIDSIDVEKPDAEEDLEKAESKNKNFIPGTIGKKIAQIKSKYFVKDKEWEKMTPDERVEFLKKKQEEVNNLYIKK